MLYIGIDQHARQMAVCAGASFVDANSFVITSFNDLRRQNWQLLSALSGVSCLEPSDL